MISKFDTEGESRSKRRSHWTLLLLIVALALGLRIFLILYPEVIHNDGAEYIRHAKEVLTGNWTGGKSSPLYPVLIAFAHTLMKNYELAGIWVSVIFGVLLVIPVFYLGKEIFNERVGIISGFVAAVHPFLYTPSGSVLTESTYHFFIATSVLFGWYAFSKGRFYLVLLFSLFASLAFLTRPEAIGFLLVFSSWVLFFNPPKERRYWMKRIAIFLVAILAFLTFSSPYLMQIRKETGKWSISKKVDVSIGSISEEGDETRLKKGTVWRHGLPLVSLIKHPLSLLAIIGTGLLNSLYKFQQVFNPILLLLALLGWIGIIQRKSLYSLKANFYVMSYHFFFFGLVFSIFMVTRRYTSQMVSISIPWAAFGFSMLIGWIHQRWKLVISKKSFTAILLVIILIALFIQGRVTHPREHRFIQREAGLWMKDHLPQGVKIMSRMPQEAFYAELIWVRIPKESYETVLKVARSNEVRYLIIDEDIEKDLPGFWGKLKEEDLVLLKDLKKKERRMLIFEIVYPEKKEQ